MKNFLRLFFPTSLLPNGSCASDITRIYAENYGTRLHVTVANLSNYILSNF